MYRWWTLPVGILVALPFSYAWAFACTILGAPQTVSVLGSVVIGVVVMSIVMVKGRKHE